MNQSVLFNDDVRFFVEDASFRFSIQSGGGLILCYLPLSVLASIINLSDDPLQDFQQNVFLIEEAAETAIDNEDFHDDGSLRFTRL